ncbi:MAG: hypothetical protein AAF958_06645 [Planctomycetota bacterium]
MHERTRRFLARLTFVGGCAIPTLGVVLAILFSQTPIAHARKANQLSQIWETSWGAEVDLHTITPLAPGRQQLRQMQLSNRETGQKLLACDALTLRQASDETLLRGESVRVFAAGVPELWRLFHERILRSHVGGTSPTRIDFKTLAIQAGKRELRFTDVSAWIDTEGGTSLATLELTPAWIEHATPIVMSIRRDRGGSVSLNHCPLTRWSLSSGRTALPLASLRGLGPTWLENLGPKATFEGSMSWTQSDTAWGVDLSQSTWSQVDLGKLAQLVSIRCTGAGTIHFDRGLIRPGIDVDMVGEIRVSDGGIESPILLSAARAFELAYHQDYASKAEWPIDLLALRFRIDGPSLSLEGRCREAKGNPNYPAGSILQSGQQILLASTGTRVPAIHLAKAFAPPAGVQAPWSSVTRHWFHWLVPPTADAAGPSTMNPTRPPATNTTRSPATNTTRSPATNTTRSP